MRYYTINFPENGVGEVVLCSNETLDRHRPRLNGAENPAGPGFLLTYTRNLRTVYVRTKQHAIIYLLLLCPCAFLVHTLAQTTQKNPKARLYPSFPFVVLVRCSALA